MVESPLPHKRDTGSRIISLCLILRKYTSSMYLDIRLDRIWARCLTSFDSYKMVIIATIQTKWSDREDWCSSKVLNLYPWGFCLESQPGNRIFLMRICVVCSISLVKCLHKTFIRLRLFHSKSFRISIPQSYYHSTLYFTDLIAS
jgi:hypothetical protein